MTNVCRDEFVLRLLVCVVSLACLIGSSYSFPFALSPSEDDRLVLLLNPPSYVYRNSGSRLHNSVESLQKWLDRFNDELEKREMPKRNIAIGRGDGFRPGK